MTATPSDLETPDAGPDMTRQRRSIKSIRRKRSLTWKIRRHANQMLRTRGVFRAGFVLLPLIGFVYISLVNNEPSPNDATSDSNSSQRSMNSPGTLSGTDAGTSKGTRFNPGPTENGLAASISSGQTVSVTQLAGAWLTDDLKFSSLSPDWADAGPTGPANREPPSPETAATGRSSRTNSYVVNEGGSLWRTGKRFIDNEILLDKLIDNLAENGMDVRSVRAGVKFIVDDLGSEGLRIVVDDGSDTYESHIFENRVTTSILSQAKAGFTSTRTASLDR